MKRYALDILKTWKNSKARKPMIIRGARQVGKTWLMKEFGKTCFSKTAYINFDANERMRSVFAGSLDIPRLLQALNAETGIDIQPADTLLIFDEVQEVPRALASLKYFNENAPEYAVVAAGSLLGIALHEGTSFPVGKVDFMDLYPLNFREFLEACGENRFAAMLVQDDTDMINSFREKYTDRLKQYLFTGGMPEAVETFITTQDYGQVRAIQKNILLYYEQDFSKHAPLREVPRLTMIWHSIPAELARENRKFIYGLIRHGARAAEYETALLWLSDCGLVHKVNRIKKPDIPLIAYTDISAFKLYLNDVGLLAAMGDIDARVIIDGSAIFEEFKGALTEQYVLQQLISDCGIKPYYYSSEKSDGEIDFILQKENRIIPIEVKAAENLQAKSLKSYHLKYHPECSVRTSLSPFRTDDWLTNIPLYAVCRISRL